ncbi:MAG: hypothetical protein F4024_14905 [Gammaproteobacteria bacterium]|nr:hypothetical protein [Gammaproteobacteria bacterium]
MAELYPLIALSAQVDREATWVGPLRPYKQPYTIRVRFRAPYAPEPLSLIEVQPRVQVLNPILVPNQNAEDGPLPHIYPNPQCPLLPYLCLFDPHAREWTLSDLIAETTIPWTERWLINYEFWQATGKWRGGGRHPSPSELVVEE